MSVILSLNILINFILELTVSFETNLLNNAICKTTKCEDFVRSQQYHCDSVKFISLSISTLGVFSLYSPDILNLLKETGFEDKHLKYIVRM